MKKMNKHLSIGVFLNGLGIFLRQFTALPHMFFGIVMGIGLVFIGIGMYGEREDLSKFRRAKLAFLKRCFNR